MRFGTVAVQVLGCDVLVAGTRECDGDIREHCRWRTRENFGRFDPNSTNWIAHKRRDNGYACVGIRV
jgi:hypothetical protein